MGCVSRKDLMMEDIYKNVGDCRRECSSHCSSLYLLKRVVAKSKVVVVNVDVQQASDKVRIKGEEWDFLCISVCIMLKHSDWGMEG